MKARAIIGSMYGDEGKGLATDYFAAQEKSLNVRFNGGSQAFHTVETPEGQRHVFSHVGSGAFNYAPTYLSKYFVTNPTYFKKEYKDFEELKLIPKIYIDAESPVTTYLDMLTNQLIELYRRTSGTHHGSVGAGFGETLERMESTDLRLTVGQLIKMQDNEILEFLEEIKNTYFLDRLKVLIGAENEDLIKELLWNYLNVNFDELSTFDDFFVEDCKYMRNKITVVTDLLTLISENRSWSQIIFEGSQGLLLDPEYGTFPHVTRSSTGLKNVLKLCDQLLIKELAVTYVTRCYTTRHGAGPLPFEIGTETRDKTNGPSVFQELLRCAPYDHNKFVDNTHKDLNNAVPWMSNLCRITVENMITCYDHLFDVVPIIRNNEIVYIKKLHFFDNYITPNFSYYSDGPTRNNVHCIKES